jgi:hypothetical protein
MPYGLIILVISCALAGKYVFMAEVSHWLKALIVGLLLLSLEWPHGIFLQLGLSFYISLYFIYLKARGSK